MPLGMVELVSGPVKMCITDILVDGFLETLVAALARVTSEDSACVEMLDEPESLTLQHVEGGVCLSYGQGQILLDDLDEFRRCTHAAVVEFLLELDTAAQEHEEGPRRLPGLRHFAASLADGPKSG